MTWSPDEHVLKWLLEPEHPSIRYWTLQDLLDQDSNNPEVINTRNLIMDSVQVKVILNAQNPEGYWVHRENMYLPKYKATTHQLLILAELGAHRTPTIEKAIEYVLEFQRNSGHFLTILPKSEKGRNSIVKDGCCFDGNVFSYMIHFGYLKDPRIQRLLHFIIDYHDDENAGWKCRAYPIDPKKVFPTNCYMGATKILKALSLIPAEERTPEVRRLIMREVANLMDNNIYQYLRNPDGTRKDKTGWKRFGFPLFYQTDILEIMDTLTRLGVNDPRMSPAINVIQDAKQKNGTWLLKNTYNGKMWIDIEEKNKPSKWITLRALRVLKRYHQ